MHHTRGRMTGCIHGKCLHRADHIRIAILEQRIKLRSVALKFRTFVENFAKGLLDHHDFFTDPDFAPQAILKVWRSTQVVGMNVGFNDPIDSQAAVMNFGNQFIGRIIRDLARGIINVHDAINDGAMIAIWVLDDICNRVGRLIKMG